MLLLSGPAVGSSVELQPQHQILVKVSNNQLSHCYQRYHQPFHVPGA